MNDSQDPSNPQPQQLVTSDPYAKFAQRGSEQVGELGEILAKVLPAGATLQRHPAAAAMQQLDNDGNPIMAKVLPGGGPLSGQDVQVDCQGCGGCVTLGACHDGGAA